METGFHFLRSAKLRDSLQSPEVCTQQRGQVLNQGQSQNTKGETSGSDADARIRK